MTAFLHSHEGREEMPLFMIYWVTEPLHSQRNSEAMTAFRARDNRSYLVLENLTPDKLMLDFLIPNNPLSKNKMPLPFCSPNHPSI